MKQQLRRRGWILAMGSNANTNVDKLIAFGQMALEQGWYDQAREYFDQALDLAPLNREAIEGLSKADEILRRKASFEPTSQKPEVTPAKPTSEGKECVDRVAGRKRRATEKREEMAGENARQEDPRLKWIAAYWEEKRRKEEERQKRVEEEERQRREQREKSQRARERTKTETRSESGDKSPYDVLNIKPNATKEEIVAAYRRMAQMYHPDKVAGLGPELKELAEQHMKAINAAYAVLGDPDRRAQYDRMRPAQDGAKVHSTIIVSEDEIVIGGRKITLPCSLDTLFRSIGPPSRKSSREWTAYVWDELGIKAHEPPGGGIVSVSLQIGCGVLDADFLPKNFYGGSVQIGSYVLNAASDAKDLRAEGFIQNGIFTSSWNQWLGKFSLFVDTDPDTQRVASLGISVQDGVEVDSTIIVLEDEIVIGGRKMTLPCSIDTLSRSIGTPSRMFPNPDTNNVYVWDKLGLYAYERPGAEITAVSLRIGRRDPRFSPLRFSPKNFYGSFVQIGSYVLTVVSDAKDLRAAGFVQFVQNGPLSIIWQQRLGKFNLFVETNQSTQRIAILSISVYGQPLPEL